MARCHRIGQDKDVTVYRLVSKDTYEEQLFNCASRKYGEEGSGRLGRGHGHSALDRLVSKDTFEEQLFNCASGK